MANQAMSGAEDGSEKSPDQMSARDLIISEIMDSLEVGYAFVRRADHTIEIWDADAKPSGRKLEWCTSGSDEDGHTLAWLMSFMDRPPKHIINKRVGSGDREVEPKPTGEE